MRVYYCAACNRFSSTQHINNYCRKCRTPLIVVPMDFTEFSALGINERYRLAYRLTNEYEKLLKDK